ncbi:putative membrane protein [Saonia flava]|uniref:Putative membrane protein n=1 Tax=Saonia flava TaxID=523696 RepID=A0A846R0D2_9FLAO|nr:vitamin K epoxide reductase family protein [Saonia flava]NJB70329.1 putative membrane protein [Saonia flava]
MKDNFVYTFSQFVTELKVKVTKTSAEQFLENHPEEGSMLAYADALNHFKIENVAAKITVDDLGNVPTPFITFFQRNGGTFTLIKSIKNDSVKWLDIQKGWMQSRQEEFFENWSGIILMAEASKKSGEKNYTVKRKSELLKRIRIPLAISLIVFFIIGMIFRANIEAPSLYLILFLKMIGMTLTSLLFVKNIDSSNELVNKLCNVGSKINCQSILDSPTAKITSWFSWSDAGFIYFFGSFFSLLISLESKLFLNTFLNVQLLFSSIAIFFSIYSLYYQGIKAKMWCTLCLGVVSIFILEAAIAFMFFSNYTFSLNISSLLYIVMGFIIPIVFLLLFKNTAIKAQESKKLNKKLTKLKTNPQIFNSLMAGQRQMPEMPQDMPVVVLGNPNAQHTLTLVSNPLCTPCANMHQRIEQLLLTNKNINCQVVFRSNPDKNDAGGQFVHKVFSLPKELQSQAMDEWFYRNDKNFKIWGKKYMEYPELKNLIEIQIQHNSWANIAKVKGTPTVFINERLLPEIIKVEDLSLLLVHITSPNVNHGFANHLI